ncbi:MAG: pitrilysin family protein [Polyangiaceae bacterium]
MRRNRLLFILPLALGAAYGAAAFADIPPGPPPQPPAPPPIATAAPVATATAAATATTPAPASALSMTVDTLENGLKVVTVPMPGSGVVAFYTLVRAGSRDEVEKGRSGYAHLFEHLMFRGTKKVPASEYERKMQAMGADNNAFTSSDLTLYVPVIPKESLADLVPVEADRFMHLDVAEAAYKDETGAVNGELNKSLNDPRWAMDEAIRELAFTKHTYGHTTIGYQKDVVDMPKNYKYSKTFFGRFYTPDDCTIWAVGDVDHAKVLELVKANYASWTGKRAEPKIDVEPDQKEPRRKDMTWKGPTSPRVLLGYKIPSAGQALKELAALNVLATFLFGEPSDLYQRIVVKEQKVLDLGFDPDDTLNKDPGLFQVSAKLKATTSFDDVIGSVQSAIDAVAAGSAKPADVEAARKHLVSALTLEMQTPGNVGVRLAWLESVTGDVHGFDRYLAALRSVTPADVAAVAKAYLLPARRNIVTLAPPSEKDKPKPDFAKAPKGDKPAAQKPAPKGGKK